MAIQKNISYLFEAFWWKICK